jgi:hypothetical protein
MYVTLFLLTLIVGCDNLDSESKAKNQEYIVQKASTKVRLDSLTGDTVPFIREFYFDYNIILIDTISPVYLHQNRFQSLTGLAVWNNDLPVYRYLKPEYFEKIAKIEMVLKRILESEKEIERVYLISNKDTINDSRYFELKQKLNESGIDVSTRVITEEEKFIMTAILKNRKYHPDKKNWENTLNVPAVFEENFEIDYEIEDDFEYK